MARARAVSRIHMVLDDPEGERKAALDRALAYFCGKLSVDTIGTVVDSIVSEVMERAFETVQASEGSLWLLDRATKELVMVYNIGPNQQRLVGVRQPTTTGIVSMVFATERGFLENDPAHSESFSRHVDDRFAQKTTAIVASPVRLFGTTVGVVSCVKLEGRPLSDVAFGPSDLRTIQRTSALVERLIEHRILLRCTGLSDE